MRLQVPLDCSFVISTSFDSSLSSPSGNYLLLLLLRSLIPFLPWSHSSNLCDFYCQTHLFFSQMEVTNLKLRAMKWNGILPFLNPLLWVKDEVYYTRLSELENDPKYLSWLWNARCRLQPYCIKSQCLWKKCYMFTVLIFL